MTERLSPAERQELLRLARDSIAAAAGGGPPPAFELDTASLTSPGAAFVSLHRNDRLRGCVGTIEARGSLRSAVVDMARAAASDDPRFAPVHASELPQLQIEISRLSPLKRVRPDEVVPGHHGLYVVHGQNRGLLLPQVASRLNWSREELLRQTCLKAGLPPEDWRGPATEIYAFTAEVFGEASASPSKADC